MKATPLYVPVSLVSVFENASLSFPLLYGLSPLTGSAGSWTKPHSTRAILVLRTFSSRLPIP